MLGGVFDELELVGGGDVLGQAMDQGVTGHQVVFSGEVFQIIVCLS